MIYNRYVLVPKTCHVMMVANLTFVIRQDNQAHIINCYAYSKREHEFNTSYGGRKRPLRMLSIAQGETPAFPPPMCIQVSESGSRLHK